MRENFRTDYAAKPLVPTGGLLNKLGRLGNAVSQGIDGSGQGVDGHIKSSVDPPPFQVGIARIIDAEDTCEIDQDEGGYEAPCRIHGRYRAQFRWYDFSDNKWKGGEEQSLGQDADSEFIYRLDAGAYHSGTNDYGTIPEYLAGDVVTAYFDPKRRWLVPVSVPPDQDITAEYSGGTTVPRIPGYNCETGELILQVMRSADAWGYVSNSSIFWKVPCRGTEASQTFAGYSTFPARPGDRIRFRIGGPYIDDDLQVTMTARFQAVARRKPNNIRADIIDVGVGGSSPLTPSGVSYNDFQTVPLLSVISTTSGLFKDSLGFTRRPNGEIQVESAQNLPEEDWVCCVIFKFTITVLDNSSSSSSHSSSSLSSSSSSSSQSSSSSTSSINSSSSSTSSVNSSSSSSSSSSNSGMSSSSSSFSRSESSSSSYDCFTVVGCFQFNAVTCTMTVRYDEICFPKAAGIVINRGVRGPTQCS